jgi:transposase
VETVGNIRCRRLVQGESVSGLARSLGISRNTVKKALRSAGEPFVYQRQPRPKLGAYLATLESWLEAEEKFPVRERRTAQRIFEGLPLEGYAGSVDQVRRYMRHSERRHRPTAVFIPQSFAPGEPYQYLSPGAKSRILDDGRHQYRLPG